MNTVRGEAIYLDDNHLNTAGARLVAPAIVDAVKRARAGATVADNEPRRLE